MQSPVAESERPPWRAALRYWPFAIVAVIGIVGYQLTQGRYYVHYMDDAWVMSWVWHYLREGSATDGVFRDGTPVLAFGKSMWLVYGLFLELFGWSKANALEVSTALIYGVGVCWYFIGRRLGWAVETSLILAFGIVLLDKVVEAGVLCRSEALTLLMVSASLLLFAHRRYFLSGLVVMVGFEVHPIALTAFFYILAWTLHERRYFMADRRRTLRHVGWFVGGALLGVGWYIWMHQDSVSLAYLTDVAGSSNRFSGVKRSEWTYLDRHFKWHSQIELVVFILALFAYVQKRQWRENIFPLAALLCVLASALLNRRPNGFYAVLAFPAFALISVSAFRRAGILRAAFAVLLLTFIFQTHMRWSKLNDFRPADSIAALQKLVPDDGLPVVGMNDFWFVFHERPFLPSDYSSSVAARLKDPAWDRLYLLDSRFKSNRRTFTRIKRHLKRHFQGEEIARFKEHGQHELKVMRYTRKPPADKSR